MLKRSTLVSLAAFAFCGAAFSATQWTCRNDHYRVKVVLDRSTPRTPYLSLDFSDSTSEGTAVHTRIAGSDYDGYSLGSGTFWVMPGNDADAHWEPCITCVIFKCELGAR